MSNTHSNTSTAHTGDNWSARKPCTGMLHFCNHLYIAFYVTATCFLSQHARFVFPPPSPGGLAPAVRAQHRGPGSRGSRVHNHFCVQRPNVRYCAMVWLLSNVMVSDTLHSVQACIPEASEEEVSSHEEFHPDTRGKIACCMEWSSILECVVCIPIWPNFKMTGLHQVELSVTADRQIPFSCFCRMTATYATFNHIVILYTCSFYLNSIVYALNSECKY